MAFHITNNGDTDTILTDGGSVKVGQNLEVVDGYLNASAPPAQIQSDWDQTNRQSVNYIMHKPIFNTINGESVVSETGQPKDIQIENGKLDNIEVNSKRGTVTNKIAEVTIDGSDILTGSNYSESSDINDNLEIETTDTLDEALGKLSKALKDDEAAITQAFLSIENATGFNDNLEYVPEESTTLLGEAKSLQDADAILMNNLTPLIDFKNQVLDVNKIVFKGGASKTIYIGQNAQSVQTGHVVEIPFEGNTVNVTNRFPPTTYTQGHDSYYTIQSMIDSLESVLLYPLIAPGRCVTFATANKVWECWQYVGPMTDDAISHQNWTDSTNWIKRW